MAENDLRPKKQATYQDVIDAPEPLIAEILDGELFLSHRLAPLQSYARTVLCAILGLVFFEGRDGPGGWIILHGPEPHFDEDVVVPDIAAWTRARVPHVPNVDFWTMAPDRVCEVVAPPTEKVDRMRKLRIYAREGVSHLWLLNPELRVLEVFQRQGATWLEIAVYGDEDVVRAEPLQAIEIELSRLWVKMETTSNGQT